MTLAGAPVDTGAPLDGLDRIRYEAPRDCPARSTVAARFERLGGDSDRIHLIIETDRGGEFNGRLELRTGRGSSTHQLHSQACTSVIDAAFVLTSVLTESSTPDESHTTAKSATASASPAPVEDEVPREASLTRRVPEAATPSDGPFRDVTIALSGGGGLGPMPGAGAALGATVGLRFQNARVAAGFRHWLAQSYEFADANDLGGEVSVSYAHLVGCWEPHRSLQGIGRTELSFPLCGGLDLGGAVGSGRGELVARSRQVAPWVAGTGSLSVWWRFAGPVAFFATVEGSVAMTRPTFSIGGQPDPLVQANPAAAGAQFGFAMHVP